MRKKEILLNDALRGEVSKMVFGLLPIVHTASAASFGYYSRRESRGTLSPKSLPRIRFLVINPHLP
jgi:hypothetical protein